MASASVFVIPPRKNPMVRIPGADIQRSKSLGRAKRATRAPVVPKDCMADQSPSSKQELGASTLTIPGTPDHSSVPTHGPYPAIF